MDISHVEKQLRKRLAYPYRWDRKQNDLFDKKTNFIYQIADFDELLAQIEARFGDHPDHDTLSNYALNRWYNYWSARAVEELFCLLDRVEPASYNRDRLVDFQLDGITFDHKTSVFPRQYNRTLEYARANPRDLIEWLYANQSQERRKHLKNRLFIVLYSRKGEHWRLKAELSWLQEQIHFYVQNFNPHSLHTFLFERDDTTVSDIIWGIK
jgi:hypothetical protein